MLVEQRRYVLHPGQNIGEYLKIYEEVGLPIQKEILGGFLGYFVTELGIQNEVTHMWAFDDLETRKSRRAELNANERWQECIQQIRPMLVSMENKIMYPTTFSPIQDMASVERLTN
ncbi:NIPSNAP family protein [Corynebacterium lubricantis]|uniref:NIPSNAP family protein n=1 Tax=Corynebacterium lubricantis TaxID=541095 RepID=UPI00035D5FD9|nr:NIPSNAP family protein [Corynebacterium lubricantis]